MVRPQPRLASGKYHSLVVYFGLVLFISLSVVRTQASLDPLPFASKEAQPDAGAVNPAQENQQIRQLELGKPIEQELVGGQSHSYQMTIAADQYVKVLVDQRGIDVVVKLFAPVGKQITEFDSEIRTQGRESVSWVAEEAGNYRLDVLVKYKKAVAGKYEIRMVELRVATEDDRALHEAEKLFAEFRGLSRASKYDEAHPLGERVLEIRERVLGVDHLNIADTLHSLALLYYNKRDYANAEPLYQRALIIREKVLGPEHPDVASSLNNLANLYSERGDYAKAEPLYQRALTIREKVLGAEHPAVAATLNNLAVLYDTKGDYAKAESLYGRALNINEKLLGPEHPEVARYLHNIAIVYYKRGNYVKAELLYGRALAINEKLLGPEDPEVARCLNNLAILYRNMGEYAKAEPLYERALTIRKKVLGTEHLDVAESLNSLANLYRIKGDYAKAEPLHQRALTIREKALGPDHPSVAQSLYNLASIYSDRGNYAKAEPLYQRAMVISEKALGPEHPGVAYSLDILGNIYRERGDYAKAESFCQRALTIWEKVLGSEHPLVANSLNSLANLYKYRGDYAKAESFYGRALIIIEKLLGPEHPHVADVLNGLALLYAAKGDIAQAVAFLSRTNAIDERSFAFNIAMGSERQKLAYLSKFSQRTDFTLLLHSQAAPNDPQAIDLAFTTWLRRKGRGLDAMTDTIAILRRHAAPEDKGLFDRLKDARSRLASLTLKEPDSANPDTYRTQLELLESEAEKLEAKLSSRSELFRVQTQPVTLAAIQAALPADSALVEFAYFTSQDPQTEKSKPPRYLAYLLAAQGQPKWVDLGEAAPIDRAVDAWRKELRSPNRTDVKRRARALDEKVMRPVRSLLSQIPGDTRRLLIAPDGALNLIPFAAFVDEQNQYLIERYSISYLTSGRDLLRMQTRQPSNAPPLVVANPNFGRFTTIAMRGGENPGKSRGRNQLRAQIDPTQIFFHQLPATEDEARAIKAVMPNALVLRREDATETALKQASGPHILHIATHGFFFDYREPTPAESAPLRVASSDLRLSKFAAQIENPLLRSGLALAGANHGKSGDDDGILTALEAAYLDLSGTKLVVLSACDTGVGEVKNGEGVQGLRRALVLAGSESQVMSLWPVSDQATKGLMILYYKALQQGEGRSEGLRQVQLRMLRGRQDQRHPFYWAAFIQSGEWANLDGQR
jgi:CHAT domain-containing protein/Tfp pilus assembly protein PilF